MYGLWVFSGAWVWYYFSIRPIKMNQTTMVYLPALQGFMPFVFLYFQPTRTVMTVALFLHYLPHH
jgi:hypothetical protein